MNTYFVQTTFKSLRILHLLFTIICFILELVEVSAFSQFAADQGIPASAYFSGQIFQYGKDGTQYYYNGVKIYSYIVLLLTLLDGGVYVVRHLFYTGPHKRDITINSIFAFLWLSAGLANIYPTFEGHSYSCPPTSSPSIAQECITKLLFIIFGWIIGILFIITSFLSYKLWDERREMYDGEWRVEALGEVVYKYKPKPNLTVKVNEPEQVMIYKSTKNSEKVRTPSLFIQTATPRASSD
ncbi:hypothetical protein C2G38_537697 [Gigaspora rosea]|uniref:MARVEL domain-containing protein n=1 Tax=Gigaspora rosea TaxID=44941 RepID=A0A397U7I4_9GLOM|nr:hypothetical protein C2G38_537697 [Gigaspora rosea]CAG8624358.1 25576_t:CDS:2 [Gigaspora rosea]